MIFRRTFLAGALSALAMTAGAAHAADKTAVAGYQTDALPSSVGIANGDFEKAAGAKIDFRRFNSGAEIFAAIASGDVQVGYVGSSPFAAATSRGLDVKAFYLASISGVDEALVVRKGSGINSLADLKGKKLAAAPVSTDHYQLLALIKSLGLNEKDVHVFAIPQPEIVAGYNRGDLDGGFVWDPALTELKKNGEILVTSKDVADKGAPTFSAWVATAAFAKENPGFLKAFASVIDKYQTSFANDKPAWGPDSDNAKTLAKLLGGTPQTRRARSRISRCCRSTSSVPINGLAEAKSPGSPRSSKTRRSFSRSRRRSLTSCLRTPAS
jgi:taurine transport system substrate-binding protein